MVKHDDVIKFKQNKYFSIKNNLLLLVLFNLIKKEL